MKILVHTLTEFVHLVKSGAAVRLYADGRWTVDGFFFALLFYLFSFGNPVYVKVALAMITILDKLEAVPVRFAAGQSVAFHAYLEAAEAVADRLALSQRRSAVNARRQLIYRIVALRFRLEAVNGGSDREEAFPSDILELTMHASLWKQKETIFHHPRLTCQDTSQLLETARYRSFVGLLLVDAELRNSFFTYALRDCLDIEFFIQYPALKDLLQISNLQGRIGRMGSDCLKIVKTPIKMGGEEKIVTLPFEGQDLNILDSSATVRFRGNYVLTMKEIFEVFKRKNIEVGNLEFLAAGITNWNVHKLGWWDATRCKHRVISLLDKEWWKPLPLFEIISKEEAQERYGNHLNGSMWNASATSTRGSATLDYDKSHSYLELVIPVDCNSYAIYDFGKSATKFPSSFFETLSMFCHTVNATVAYPDENVYYTHRQHAQHSFALNRKQGYQLLELIRLDLIKARAGNFVYQIESENCAKWLYEKLQAVLGNIYNLFNMKLLDTEPFGPVSWIFKCIRMLPESWQVPLLMFFHLMLGAYHETWILENNRYINKSLRTHRFWQTGEVYLPAFLHKQIEVGIIGVVATLENICQSKYLRKKLNGPGGRGSETVNNGYPLAWMGRSRALQILFGKTLDALTIIFKSSARQFTEYIRPRGQIAAAIGN